MVFPGPVCRQRRGGASVGEGDVEEITCRAFLIFGTYQYLYFPWRRDIGRGNLSHPTIHPGEQQISLVFLGRLCSYVLSDAFKCRIITTVSY